MTVAKADQHTDGRHDFFIGQWRIHNRKLADVLDRECTEWLEFEATGEMRTILDGLGNIDHYSAVLPDGRPLEGFTLRLFDPETRRWKIWWASTTRPGYLDQPVEGRFTGRHGQFFCDDVLNGQPVRVRYDWTHIDDQSARWEQAFSYDDGKTWQSNWYMPSPAPDRRRRAADGGLQHLGAADGHLQHV